MAMCPGHVDWGVCITLAKTDSGEAAQNKKEQFQKRGVVAGLVFAKFAYAKHLRTTKNSEEPKKNVLYHSAGVVDTRHFAKIRVSQGDLN